MKHAFRFLAIAFFLFWAALAQAQVNDDGTTNYEAWEDLAGVAELVIENGTAETDRLEVIRDSLAEFREQFSADRSQNRFRIDNLNDQIGALGPPPEDGEEPANVAVRRAELNEQLRILQAPQNVAEEAFVRANGLIEEIDHIIRERQTRKLLSMGPSPVNPIFWPSAARDLANIIIDTLSAPLPFDDPEKLGQARDNMPLSVLMLAVGILLIAKGRNWAGRALKYLREIGGRGAGVWSFLVSLLRIALPLTGLLLITEAIQITGLVGPKLALLLSHLPLWGAVLFGFWWLSERLFAREDDVALLPLARDQRKRARFYMLVLSVVLVARSGLEVLLQFEPIANSTEAVLTFPFVVVTALVILFMGLSLRSLKVEDNDDAARSSSLRRVVRLTGNGLVAIAVVSPVMAAIGYAEAGNALLYPTIASMILMGFVLTLQRFFADFYVLVTLQGAEARDALIPALIGFGLVLVSLPLLALIWGARVTDLTELWQVFSRGFAIGETTISPADFLVFLALFGIGYTITRIIQSTLKNSVLPKTKIDIGGQNALVSGIGYVGIFLAALFAITGAGIDLTSFALVAGALSVGIGFGLRTIVENFVAGIILLVGRPVSEGDWIEVAGQMGYVRDISVRSTRIETFDRTDVIVPNADLVSGTVTNYTRGNTIGRLIVKVGVAYGTDTRLVSKILKEIASAQPMVLARPEPNVAFVSFGADALEFEIRMVLRDVNWILSVRSDVNHAIAERFAEEGIEIPFAQRDIWLRNPEVLRERSEQKTAREGVELDDSSKPVDPDRALNDGEAEK